MPAPDLPAVLDRLFASLARGQLLLLVGAGASRWAGLPSWREAVSALARDLVPRLRARFPDARCSTPPRWTPPRCRSSGRSSGCPPWLPAISTIDFDDLLERTFAWEGRRCQVVAGPEDLKAWRFDREGRRLGASSDLERATTELDGIVRVDLEAGDTDRPRELLAFLGALADRCERELRGRPASPPAPA
jgi:hypothetical protein